MATRPPGAYMCEGKVHDTEQHSLNVGGFIFESDVVMTGYGHTSFGQFVDTVEKFEFKLIQLGGLKSTSGRRNQKVNFTSSLRNHFGSNIAHDFYEDLKEKFKTELKRAKSWIGGSHAYYIHLDAIDLLEKNQVGFLNAIDDYFKSISQNTKWVGRTRQNLFIQSEAPSLIKQLGR
jgi:hypothetical protein